MIEILPDRMQDRWQELSRKDQIGVVSFGLGGFVILVSILLFMLEPDTPTGAGLKPIAGMLFVLGTVGSFAPYGIYVWLDTRRYRQMEKELAPFLRNLSEGIKSGMSMTQAWRHASQNDYGRLNEEVDKAGHQLSWGIPFPEAMERMANRIEGSGLIRRTIYIILQSYEAGGNVSETLDAIAQSATSIKNAEKEKRSVLMQQVYIIYAIHFIFIGIILAVYYLLDAFLLNLGGGGGLAGGGLPGGGGFSFNQPTNFCQGSPVSAICTLCGVFGIGNPSDALCYYKSLFLLMIVVEGVFNGLVVGEITEGKVASGVKHSLIMAPFGLVIYLIAMTLIG